MSASYTTINEDGQVRPHPWPGLMMGALAAGDAETITNGATLVYPFNNLFIDTDNFSTNFDVKREGLYHASAYVLLTWGVAPTTGTVIVSIRDEGASIVCSWRQYVIGMAEVRLTLGGSHIANRDGLFEVFIDNGTDQTLDATVKMGVFGIVVTP